VTITKKLPWQELGIDLGINLKKGLIVFFSTQGYKTKPVEGKKIDTDEHVQSGFGKN